MRRERRKEKRTDGRERAEVAGRLFAASDLLQVLLLRSTSYRVVRSSTPTTEYTPHTSACQEQRQKGYEGYGECGREPLTSSCKGLRWKSKGAHC